MAKNGTEAIVTRLPECDICKATGVSPVPKAKYDAKTKTWGSWANMCEEHMKVHGIGLGTGLGQRLIPVEKDGE